MIKKITSSNGAELPTDPAKETRVVSPETARTTVDMFRAVTQKDETGVQQGSGAPAAIDGYQVSGKTGTAQQIDPDSGAYSNSSYWINFAGIAPADKPRFVLGIMLDNPQRGTDGGAGGTAAPLFHDIMAWMLDHYNVSPSEKPGPKLMLEANQ